MSKIWVGLIGAFVIAGMSGCAGRTPDCADSNTTSLVHQIVSEAIDNTGNLPFIGKMLPKNWGKDLKIEVESIRAVGYDENIDKYTCSAQVKIADNYSVKLTGDFDFAAILNQTLSTEGITLIYTSETMADSKRQYVEVQNIDDLVSSLFMAGVTKGNLKHQHLQP